MSKDRDKRKAPLDLVGAGSEREPLGRASLDAVRAAVDPAELSGADHEALLALTLGDDVAEIDEQERRAAEALRLALDGHGRHPLAELAWSLRAARQPNASLDSEEHELLLALTIGEQAAELERDDDALRLARALDGHGQHPLASWAPALRAAAGGGELDEGDHAVLLALSIDDDMLDEAGRHDAEALRRALEGDGDHPLAELATALSSAAGHGRDLDQLSHERIVRQALSAPLAPRRIQPRRGTVLEAVVAIAAGIALFFGSLQWIETQGGGTARRPTPSLSAPPLVQARSTQELFDPATPFPAKGGESERLDRIVAARSADLRANRFAAWGVR